MKHLILTKLVTEDYKLEAVLTLEELERLKFILSTSRKVETYSCQMILPNGRRCGKFAKYVEKNGMCLCEGCHRRIMINPAIIRRI